MNKALLQQEVQTSIESSNLSKVYWDGARKLTVLSDVNFSVASGESVAVLGPSGSGKTTLLCLLSGLDRPTTGMVKILGNDVWALSEKDRARMLNRDIGFVFQFYHLLPELTAVENVSLPAWISDGKSRSRSVQARAEHLLTRVGLKERMTHFPNQLSGGEQQRVAIARALMNDPKILFCDEPTGNLDPRMGEEVAALLHSLFCEEKKTLVIVTHDQKVAKIADRIWQLA